MSNSLKDALKKLCYRITGKKSNKESIQEVVNDLTKNYNGASTDYVDQKINEKLATVYTYKGSVSTYASLPMSGEKIGDVYNVLDTGNNYAWSGTAWDDLAGFCLANPSGEATADLSKLKVGSIIYGLADKSYVEGLKRVLKNNSDSEDLMEFTEDSTIEIKDELHCQGDVYVNDNSVYDIKEIGFSDGSTMDTAPHLYRHNVRISLKSNYQDCGIGSARNVSDPSNIMDFFSNDIESGSYLELNFLSPSNAPITSYDEFPSVWGMTGIFKLSKKINNITYIFNGAISLTVSDDPDTNEKESNWGTYFYINGQIPSITNSSATLSSITTYILNVNFSFDDGDWSSVFDDNVEDIVVEFM